MSAQQGQKLELDLSEFRGFGIYTSSARGNGDLNRSGSKIKLCGCGTKTYDYVVVGSGPGASAAAYQLSKDPNNRILVLESGTYTDNDPLVKEGYVIPVIPERVASLTTPSQPGLNKRSITIDYARQTGGCSAHNGMGWDLPNRKYFEDWALSTGAPWWGPEQVQATLDEISTMRNSLKTALHGEGPMELLQPVRPGKIGDRFSTTIAQPPWNLPTSFNHNDLSVNKVNVFEILPQRSQNILEEFVTNNGTLADGIPCAIRSWASEGLLDNQPNICLVTNAPVTKVLFDESVSPPKAIGVLYQKNDKTHKVKANKAVLVGGGVLGTSLLMHASGVGKQANLESFGIPVVSNVPVGDNYKTSAAVTLTGYWGDPTTGAPLYADTLDSLTVNKTCLQRSPMWSNHCFFGNEEGERAYKWSNFGRIAGVDVGLDFNLGALLVEAEIFVPTSTGLMTSNYRSSTFDIPLFNPHMLEDPTLVDKWGDNLLLQREFLFRLNEQVVVDKTEKEGFIPLNFYVDMTSYMSPLFATDIEFRRNWIRNNAAFPVHDSSTCRMGPNDGANVVDNRGAVYGTQNLYIVDNSILPREYHNSTQSAAYIIGGTIGRLLRDG